MRPGIPTLISLLLLLASIPFAPTWAVLVLAGVVVVTVAVDIARYRASRTPTERNAR